MRASVRAALERGVPCIAECGGFMYLLDAIGDHPMAGALPGRSFDAGKLTRFGYLTLTAQRDNLLCRAGESIAAHEFHRWDADDPGKAFLAENFKYFGYGYLNAPTDTIPNVPLVFYTFRIMVALGCYFILLFAVVLALVYRDTIDKRRWLLLALVWSIPLAYIASVSGWIVAEVGRQPWTIQDLLPTVASVSRINASSVMVTFFIFVALFTTLLIAELMIVTKQIKIGPKDETAPADKPNK